MFVNTYNTRFKVDMYSDHRLVNTSPHFCLCTSCVKSDLEKGVICERHDEFMRMTQRLQIAAPVFACPDFVEGEDLYNYLDPHFDEDSLTFCKESLPWIDHNESEVEHSRKLKRDWDLQVEYWEKMK